MLQDEAPAHLWTSFVYEDGKVKEFYDANKLNFLIS
jgi:hypothetical protein